MVKDREAWHAAVHRVTRAGHDLVTEQQQGLFMCLQMELFFSFLCLLYLIHSSVDEHLGCFHVMATVNNAAINIGVYVSF